MNPMGRGPFYHRSSLGRVLRTLPKELHATTNGSTGSRRPAVEIIGVDFSGAKPEKDTWVAAGLLGPAGLVLRDCRPVRRAELAELLASLPGDSVAALDFPFSVPEAFACFWRPGAASMPDLWAAAAGMELARFVALRDDFVASPVSRSAGATPTSPRATPACTRPTPTWCR